MYFLKNGIQLLKKINQSANSELNSSKFRMCCVFSLQGVSSPVSFLACLAPGRWGFWSWAWTVQGKPPFCTGCRLEKWSPRFLVCTAPSYVPVPKFSVQILILVMNALINDPVASIFYCWRVLFYWFIVISSQSWFLLICDTLKVN